VGLAGFDVRQPIDAPDHMKEGMDPQENRAAFVPPPVEPAVLREAGGVVAIAKPPGLATQAPPGLPSVESWLRGRLPAGAYVGIPHRLDRAVSGVVLMAVTPRAARTLSRQFERREVRKTYLALLSADGPPAAEGATFEWRDFIVKVENEPRARVADPHDPAAREAVSLARVARVLGDGTLLVELEPVTGRMHQLRVQAAARSMPILGDTLYGASLPFGSSAGDADPRLRRIALHAWRIDYRDPGTGHRECVEAALPPWWPPAARSAGDGRSS